MDQAKHAARPGNAAKQKSPITILRDYLTSLTPEIIERLSHIDEHAMRAKIVTEYMQENAIEDINEGIRSFTAFERHRLQQLGMIGKRDLRAIKNALAASRLTAVSQQG